MATWHQLRGRMRGVRLDNPGLYTVVTDPPGESSSSMLFRTEEQAAEFLANLAKHNQDRAACSYMLKPRP